MSETWIENTIREKLIEIGAEGLCHAECGCMLDCLMPCGEPGLYCVPAKNNVERALAEEVCIFFMEPMEIS